MTEVRGLPVTFDVNVLVRALTEGNSTFHAWPSPPPVGPHPSADCVGVVNDCREFALCLSPHVLRNVARVLLDAEQGFGWPAEETAAYLAVLDAIATASGGGVFEPAVRVTDCEDFEDNRILELALASGSVLIVSSDAHLLDLSPWRGIAVITPRELASRVDVARRSRRRR